MKKEAKKLIVAMVTYNHQESIERAIRSVVSQKSGHDIKLVVVDNNSKDNTTQIIKDLQAEGLQFEFITNPANTGFTGGNNLIFNKYLEQVDYFYLHNADAYFKDEYTLDQLLDLAESRSGESLIQPCITDPLTSVSSYGNEIFYLGFSYMSQKGRRSENPTDEIGAVSGASMLISRKILEKVGLFDDAYFAYLEDSEFSTRVRLAGFRCEVANQIEVYHEHEFARYGAFKLFLIERNRFYFLAAFYSPLSLLFLMPVIIMTCITNAAFIAKQVGFKTVVEVYKDILEHGSKFSSSRRRLGKFTTRDSMIRLYDLMSGRMASYENKGIVPIAINIANLITSVYFRLFKFVHRVIISRIAY